MSLQNAFAIGPCTVYCTWGDIDTRWTGTLGMGQSSPTFSGHSGDTEVLQITVDEDGNVSLINTNYDVSGGTNNYWLSVMPQYSLDNATGLQASGIEVATHSSVPLNASSSLVNGDNIDLTLTSDTPWTPTGVTPDPADLSSQPDYVEIAVWMGNEA